MVVVYILFYMHCLEFKDSYETGNVSTSHKLIYIVSAGYDIWKYDLCIWYFSDYPELTGKHAGILDGRSLSSMPASSEVGLDTLATTLEQWMFVLCTGSLTSHWVFIAPFKKGTSVSLSRECILSEFLQCLSQLQAKSWFRVICLSAEACWSCITPYTDDIALEPTFTCLKLHHWDLTLKSSRATKPYCPCVILGRESSCSGVNSNKTSNALCSQVKSSGLYCYASHTSILWYETLFPKTTVQHKTHEVAFIQLQG